MAGHDEYAPTIDQLKAFQKRHGIEEHVVYVGEHHFVMAHTDEERATINLEDCELHRWMEEREFAPAGPGYAYRVVKRPHDPTSESFRSDGSDSWVFERLGGPCRECGWDDACGDPPGEDCHS